MNTTSDSGAITFDQVTEFDRDEFLARAEVIGKMGEADAMIADKNCRATDRVIETIRNAQIADIWKPKRYGGLGADLQTYYDMIRIVSRHNMATGWLTYFYSIHEVWVGYMPPAGRDEIFNDGGFVADVLAPVGKAERDGDGYRLHGQWNFASGIIHSGWIGLGAMAQLPGGDQPEYCLFAVKVEDCEIIENWDTLGLRGTGSNGVSPNGAFVPMHRVLSAGKVFGSGTPMGGDYDASETIYRVPFLPFFAGFFTAVALGGAQRMVDEFEQRTATRTRVYQGGASAATSGPMPTIMAHLKLKLFEMEGLVERYSKQLDAWREESHVVNTPEEKAMMYAMRGQIAQKGVDIAVQASQALGGTAMFKGDPVELFIRDMITIGGHASHLYADAMSIYGGSIFGGPAHPVW